MTFWPILVIAIILILIYVKEEKVFEKERKNPDRKKGFYKPEKLQTPSEIAEEARQAELEEGKSSDRFEV